MKRFLVKGALREGQRIFLPDDETRHARLSLRLAAGDALLLANGEGAEAQARLRGYSEQGAEVEVLSVRLASGGNAKLELIQAPLKGPRMDWLVEKAAELGCARLRLAKTLRTVGGGERLERWERLAAAALKQSGNLEALDIVAQQPLADLLRALPEGAPRFVLSPSASLGLHEAITSAPSAPWVLLAVGPEGGFAPEEETALQTAGFLPCRLAAHILRGETAALAALAIAQHALACKNR